MTWLAQHWDAIIGVAGAVIGAVKHRQASKAKRRADELAAQLDAIRVSAGTKAAWER